MRKGQKIMITIESREELITLGKLLEVMENVNSGDYNDVVLNLENALKGEKGEDNIVTFINSLDEQETSMLLEAILYDLAD